MEKDFASLINRLSDLEKKVEEGVVVRAESVTTGSVDGQTLTEAKPQKEILAPAVTEDVQQVVDNWNKVVSKLESALVRHVIIDGRLTVAGDDRLVIVFTDQVEHGTVSREETVKDIENAIAEVVGKAVKIDVKLLEKGQHFEDHFVEVKKRIVIDNIEEEDF